MKSTISQITEQLSARLLQGSFGCPGEPFLTVKMLAEVCCVSTDSAFRIMRSLAERHLIRLHGKHYYITTGYVPPKTPYGEKLAKSRRNSFGMIVNRIDSPFFSAIVRELSTAVSEIGYSLYVMCGSNAPEQEARMMDELLELGVCGIFTNPGIAPEMKDIYRICPLPVVSIGRDLHLPNCDTVLVDNENAGKQVADHLLDCGCEAFSYVGLSRYLHEDPRLKGYAGQLRKRGYALPEDRILAAESDKNGIGDIESVSGQLDMVLRSLPAGKKLGIFCYHDLLAVSVLQRVRHCSHHSARSYNIPQDVSVVGFDDLPVAQTITPALTTVHYPYHTIVQQSLAVMLDYLQNPEHKTNSHIVPSALFIRASTNALCP